jgi:hypothetical protein
MEIAWVVELLEEPFVVWAVHKFLCTTLCPEGWKEGSTDSEGMLGLLDSGTRVGSNRQVC